MCERYWLLVIVISTILLFAPAASLAAVFCGECGAKNADGARECVSCQATIATIESEQGEPLFKVYCGECGDANSRYASNCDKCGAELSKPKPPVLLDWKEVHCGTCGTLCERGDTHCGQCGTALPKPGGRSGSAQESTSKGSSKLAIGGWLNMPEVRAPFIYISVNLAYGRFMANGVELGAEMTAQVTVDPFSNSSNFIPQGFINYHFLSNSKNMGPYLGATAGVHVVYNPGAEHEVSANSFTGGIKSGMNFFFEGSDNSFYMESNLNYTRYESPYSDDHYDAFSFTFKVGLAFYFTHDK